MTKEENTKLIQDEMSEKIVEKAEEMAKNEGTDTITVRKILNSLGITNRVFYNRFHNIGEVLELVYEKTVLKLRKSITKRADEKKDFFAQIDDLVSEVILASYDTKSQISSFVFENDSNDEENRTWWVSEIKKLIDHAIEMNYIKKVDSDVLSYSIWCFCRGYNADVVSRKIPKEEAVSNFRYSFKFLLDGLKK